LAEYLTVGEAAQFLGVSPWTLRNWDKAGKLRPGRHPKNGYRIYRHEDLAAILDQGGRPAAAAPAGGLTDWGQVGLSEHVVQFYETDAYLVESVGAFLAGSLGAGHAGVVVATGPHRDGIDAALRRRGIDVERCVAEGRYVSLDAAETLARFVEEGEPDAGKFADTMGGVVARLAAGGRRVRAFGEMVALLWAAGNRPAAIGLEELWNELAKSHRFALLCAYPMDAVSGGASAEAFESVCGCHGRVLPAESYSAMQQPGRRLAEVARLQQKARSLEAEVAHRAAAEKALARRERELSDFFDNATEGLHSVGPDGTILWANKAELDLLGYAAHEYVGRHIAEFHADRDVIEDMLARLGRGESMLNYPARMLHRDGSIRHVLVNSNACFEDGQFACTRCYTRDVTALKRAEEERSRRAAAELEASQAEARRRAAFLNAISHDLGTPLNGLLLQANLARVSAEIGDPGTLGETLTQIESSVAAKIDILIPLLEAAR
jgi:PAS domain S-box-containing protein